VLRYLLALLCALILVVEGHAGAAPADFVQRSEARFNELRALTDKAARRSGCDGLLGEAFDKAAIVHAVAGPLWDILDTSRRAAFRGAISRRLV
jgi:hypothetical protein